MNVCMVTYSFYEMDNRVRRYAETLAKRGDTVDVIALRASDAPRSEVMDGVRVFRIQQREPNERGKWTYFAKIFLFLLKSSLFLTIRHVRKPYDLVHVHSVPDFEVFAAWFPKIAGASIILDIHDLVPELYADKFKVPQGSWIKSVLLTIEKLSARFADHVIIANDLWRTTLVSRSVESSKCTAILNFPDPAIFHRQTRRVHRAGGLVLLYPGTLNHHQGLDIAIRAFALIKDKLPGAEFHIYGRGPEKDHLAQLVQQLGLQDTVLLKNPIPLTEVAKVIENSDLGIVPKRSESFGNEAFSTKILEFMSLGVPVLVSDTKVDKFYFNDSIVQFFRSGDEQDLADKMLRLATSEKLRRKLRDEADVFIRSNNWDVRKSTYLDLVDSLTAGRVLSQGGLPGREVPSYRVEAASLTAESAKLQ